MPEFIPVDSLNIVRLNEGTGVSDFVCQSEDLESFLKEDALAYQKNKLAMTYLCLFQNKVVGYVTLAADSIKLDEGEKAGLPENKARLYEFPGIKIARLAVRNDCQHRGLGSTLVKASLGRIVEFAKDVGCRFATVDAVPEAEPFYQKMGFVRNLHKQEAGRSTVSMRYDLLYYTG